ncbi:MAG: hypothetical protein ACQUYJ_09810, partial [Ferruginibacter sp.]
MKKILLLCIVCTTAVISFAQKETFDIVTYTPPKKWKKEVTANIISYTIINKQTNNWCRINIVKSTISKGSIEQDFESEWQELVVKSYSPAEAPQLNEVQEAEGWKIKAGGAKFIFNNTNAMAMLTTISGYDRCVSIVATTNGTSYLKDIETLLASVDLKKTAIIPAQTPTTNSDNAQHPAENSIIGTWCISASDNSNYRVKNGVMSTIFRQYTFKANGTYTCNIKTFDPLMNSTFLGRENGSFQINGNNLAISPQKAVLEEWSKKGGRDEWDKLLKTQKIALEKITYQFTKQYISEISEWQLILKANNPTKRDGPFNNYDKNAWIYIISSPSHPLI